VIAGAVIGLSVALFITFVTGRQIWDFGKIKEEKKALQRKSGEVNDYDSLDI
jgi:hypothetical protein